MLVINTLLPLIEKEDKLDSVLDFLSRMNNHQAHAQHKQHDSIEAIVAERVKATANIIDKVRRSQDIDKIFKDTTEETRNILKSDRSIIYQFNPDWSGQVVAESVGSGWISLIIEQNNDEVLSGDLIQKDCCLLRDWSKGEQENIFEPDSFLQETGGGKYAYGQKKN